MADETVVAALRRFFSLEEVETAYQAAFAAYQERAIDVVITSASFEGGGSTGQITGDPRDLMQACEARLKEIDDENAGVENLLPGTSHVDFSKRYLGT